MARSRTRSGGGGANFAFQNSNWIALAAPVLIFAAQFAYGAMTAYAALLLALMAALLVLGAMLDGRLRDDFARSRALVLPSFAFLAVLLVVIWSLTPYVPGGPHPVWSYTQERPAAGTADRSLTGIELIKLCGLACLFLVGAITGSQDQRAELSVRVTLVCGAVLALWSFGAQVTGVYGPELQLQGPFANANATATVMGALFVIALALTIRDVHAVDAFQSATRRLPLAAAALIFIICLMMTASRGGTLATAVGLVTFGILFLFGRREPMRRSGWAILGAIGVLATIVALAGDRLFGRLEALRLGDHARDTIFQVHWQAFQASPWIGNGLGTFDIVNRTMLDISNLPDLWNVRAAHNVYLSWLELGGVLAAAPMFLCIGAIIFHTLRGSLRRSRMTTVLFALLGVDVLILAHGLTDFALEIYAIAAMWSFLLGLQFTLAQGSRR